MLDYMTVCASLAILVVVNIWAGFKIPGLVNGIFAGPFDDSPSHSVDVTRRSLDTRKRFGGVRFKGSFYESRWN
jgi:hypothetical protein